MKIEWKGEPGHSALEVSRGDGVRCKSESAFFYAVKKALQKAGHDVIKKCPDKDGHMFGAPYYIRWRDGSRCLFDNYYDTRWVEKAYNDGETVTLWFHSMLR